MLCKEGYCVLTANDGQEALEICHRFKDPIHLLLTDKTMPRMNGLELAESILKKRSEIKILIMSGETVETILNKNTPDAFLPKPFIPPTLLTCVRRLLSSEFKPRRGNLWVIWPGSAGRLTEEAVEFPAGGIEGTL
jgi:CheY-like chemotaxis protein